MGRRAKPAKTKAKARKAPAKTAARDRALAEAREQQQATSEILRVIATSPGDLQPVLDAVVRSAARLCRALDVAIFRVEGDVLRLVAHDGVIPPVTPVGTLAPGGRGSVNGRAVLEGRTVHVPDLQAAGDEFPEGSANARRLGWRATLIVPLVREGTVIGTIAVRRTEARPFSDSQIALLQTFADQAVIAIENARLFTEVTTALDTQTATADRWSWKPTACGEASSASSARTSSGRKGGIWPSPPTRRAWHASRRGCPSRASSASRRGSSPAAISTPSCQGSVAVYTW